MNNAHGLPATIRYVPRQRLERSAILAQQQRMAPGNERQVKDFDHGLTHNLGGHRHENVCAVDIVGRHRA